ncbi:MAG: 3-methyl-2-oxobutanoate hydroxymethyltransferase [bacterium]|nr:3-methyl-2-oxobutanoate hydroxymethyltransferase [bacterium]
MKGTSVSVAIWPTDRRTTILDLQRATDCGVRWAMLTSYDCLTASVFEAAGVRALLVGDTCGQVVFGQADTVAVTMDQMIPMVQAVVRASSTALVVADLPFGTYQSGPSTAVGNAVRHLKEGGAQAVKLEGGRVVLPQVRALVDAGIPVMGHLGLTPQTAGMLGGVQRVQGRGKSGERLLEDALELEAAGAFAVVLESIPASLGERVSSALSIPTVGIGAGPACDAQILVWQDMAGLTKGRQPKFVKHFGDLDANLRNAAASFVSEVMTGVYPDEAHSYA